MTKREGIKGQVGGSKPGWHHSEETKARLREKANQQFATEESRKLIGQAISRGMSKPEVREKISKANAIKFADPAIRASCASYGFKGKSHTVETRQRMTVSAQRRWDDPEQHALMLGIAMENAHHYVQGLHYSHKAGYVMYRSSYELDFFDALDNDTSVESYEVEPATHIIPYIFNSRTRYYHPDVLIHFKDGDWALVEIKPEYAMNSEQNQAKFAAAEGVYGDKFCVMTEQDLYPK